MEPKYYFGVKKEAYKYFEVDELKSMGYSSKDINDLLRLRDKVKKKKIKSISEAEEFIGYGRFDKRLLIDTFNLKDY